MSGTLKVTTLQDGASAVANLTFDTNGNTTAGGTVAMASSFLRNRIINGAMQIDQRNAGASTTPTASGYNVDRWNVLISQASKFSVQQNAGSVTPPTGFTNYLGFTSLSSYSVLAGDYFINRQAIEGYNMSDLAWGTANAKTVTLSFQVYSSLTGTFGGALQNNASTRSYPFSYSIPVANTWTTVSVTIAGDTSGTWQTTTNTGIFVCFSLGMGSTYSGTAGSWAATNYLSTTGAVSVVGTNGATFYITGVQLEVGTVATPFERRQYGQELMLCQRYYEKSLDQTNAVGTLTNTGITYWYNGQTGASALVTVPYKVVKRTAATITLYSGSTGASGVVRNNTSAVDVTGYTTYSADSGFAGGTNAVGALAFYSFQWTASAEL